MSRRIVTSAASIPRFFPKTTERAIVDALRDIAYTHINQFDTETILRELRPRYYVKGKDWEGRLPPDQLRICAENGIGRRLSGYGNRLVDPDP